MDPRSKATLLKMFESHRIVFWYDDKNNLRSEYEELDLPGIKKVEIDGNEFTLKYRVLREDPDTKFLLYHEGPKPKDDENWLLDLQQYQGEFHTDQSAIILSELGLGVKFLDLVNAHQVFFDNKNRRAQFKKLLSSEYDHRKMRLALLAVCCGSDSIQLDQILMELLNEGEKEDDSKIRLVERCDLSSFLWQEVDRLYGYHSQQPNVTDFTYELFTSKFALITGEKVTLNQNGEVFLSQWKDRKTYTESYEYYSALCEKIFHIKELVDETEFTDLLEYDLYRSIDQRILRGILKEVVNRTSSDEIVTKWITARKNTHWYASFEHYYEALQSASRFFSRLQGMNLSMQSMADGIRLYSTTWKEIDSLYRKYFTHIAQAENASLLEDLTKKVENHYNNNFLLDLNSRWHEIIEKNASWDASPYILQKKFFTRYIRPVVEKDNKICVIISDALRYEVADELVSLVNGFDRMESEIEPMLSMLPSFTQLGMASLLPNRMVSFDDNGAVLVDGLPTLGRANREKILKMSTDDKAVALPAEDVMNMNVQEFRSHLNANQVIYVYHNTIDKVGDSRDSEEKTFLACRDALDELKKLVKKITSANANNVIITADHGFLYQNSVLDESDFVGIPISTEQAILTDRRFLLGKDLPEHPSMLSFSLSELHIDGDLTLQLPHGINRMRVKGSGSRYVHGGASLQEVVLPIVRVRKKREGEVQSVHVTVKSGSNNRITSGQLGVRFYQDRPVSDKVRGLRIKAAIYTKAGVQISNTVELNFASESMEARERETSAQFILLQSSETMKNQEVLLRLETPRPNSSKWDYYESYTYRLERLIATDF